MGNNSGLLKAFRWVFWIFILMGLMPASIGGYFAWQEYESLQWIKHEAKIVEGGFFHPKGLDSGSITVEYQLNGKKHRHTSPHTFPQPSVVTNDLQVTRYYAYGATVSFYYDPQEVPVLIDIQNKIYKRNLTVLQQGFSDDIYVPFIFSIIFFLIAFGSSRLSRLVTKGLDKVEDFKNSLPKQTITTVSSSDIAHDEEIEVLKEDRSGRVLLDNTKRAGRIVATLIAMLLFTALYFGLIWSGATHEELRLFFAIPIIWGVIVAFIVSDTVIIKREGIMITRRGWLFLVRKKTYMLHHFNKVTVTGHVHEQHRASHEIRGPRKVTYNISLEGKETVSIYVSSLHEDTIKLARRIAKHLKFDIEYE